MVTVIIIANSSHDKTDYSLLDNNGKEVFSLLQNTFFMHSFTTYDGGFYSVCIKNQNKASRNKQVNKDNTTTIIFDIKQGIAAKDYSSVSTMQNLKPIELNVRIKININT